MASMSPSSTPKDLAPQARSTIASHPVAGRQPPAVKLPVPKRPPLTPSAIFTLIQTIKEAGRRLGMSDCAVATACTLFHRMVRVLTIGEETGPFADIASVNVAEGETVSAAAASETATPATFSANDNPATTAIDGSIRSTLGDVDPYVSCSRSGSSQTRSVIGNSQFPYWER